MSDEFDSLGMGGIKVLSGTSAITPDAGKYICAVKALNGDMVIDELTVDAVSLTTDITVKEGVELVVGRCSSIKLASGFGWAYQKAIVP